MVANVGLSVIGDMKGVKNLFHFFHKSHLTVFPLFDVAKNAGCLFISNSLEQTCYLNVRLSALVVAVEMAENDFA